MGRRTDDKFEDDGRTIADMSGVGRPSLFGHMPEGGRDSRRDSGRGPEPGRPSRPARPEDELTREERRWAVLAALKAGVLIGLAYLVLIVAILALVIWLGSSWLAGAA